MSLAPNQTPETAALRRARIDAFAARAGWGDARREMLAGDASARVYHRLRRGTETAIVMDADPACGNDTAPFLRMTGWLLDNGFSAPRVLAQDPQAGLLLLEDLGDALFARRIETHPADEALLYETAIDVLVQLARLGPPPGAQTMPVATQVAMIDPLFAHAPEAARIDPATVRAALSDALESLPQKTPVCALRDYHAENLLWLEDRSGHRRAGLLDYQDAFAGPPAYDLASLLRDARRDVSPELHAAMLARYAEATGTDLDALTQATATLAVQRNLRIVGLFHRLATQGKPGYLRFLPRVQDALSRDLAHPALAPLARTLTGVFP